MRAQPHSASAVHHHGEQDTVVYAVSGKGSVVSEMGKTVSLAAHNSRDSKRDVVSCMLCSVAVS